MNKTLLYSLCLVALFSCNNTPVEKAYTLKESSDGLSFSLNSRTKNFIIALFPYTDEDGKEYLTFQNQGQNQLLFYDMHSQELEFITNVDMEGSNGVGSFIGYAIKSLDSILLSLSGKNEIAIINKKGIVVDKIGYSRSVDGIDIEKSYATSYTPITFLGNLIYITPMCNRWAAFSPVAATIDLGTKEVQALPMPYPKFKGADNRAKKSGVENNMSCCFDGRHFIYSFHFDENIKVASIDHQTINEIPIKSNYIDKVKLLDDYGNLTPNDACENPNYGGLIYDKYRKVYYRIAYPACEVDKSIRGLELLQYGRKNFSIIILNEAFDIIGETMFPDYTYNSTLMFVREDGLYISDSHYLNKNFDDNILSFRKFELSSL